MQESIEQDQTQEQDTEVADCAEEITGTFEAAFNLLIQRRERQIAAENAPLDREIESLARESATIEDDLRNLEGLLESKTRIAQHEADQLRLAGKHAEAEAKLEEMRAAQHAPKAMRARQQELERRAAAVAEEKEEISQSTLDAFFKESQTIIRGGESLFSLLNRVEQYLRQERRGFVSDNALADLTSEWSSGNRLYGGRR